VTTSTGGANFIVNGQSQKAANFNISGTGIIGGNLGVGNSSPIFKLQVDDPSNAGFRVQTNTGGGRVAHLVVGGQ